MGWVGAAAAVVGTLYSVGSGMMQSPPQSPPIPPPPPPEFTPPTTSPSTPTSPTNSPSANPTPSLVSPVLQQPGNMPNILNSPADPFSKGEGDEGLIKKGRAGGMKVGV